MVLCEHGVEEVELLLRMATQSFHDLLLIGGKELINQLERLCRIELDKLGKAFIQLAAELFLELRGLN